MIAATILVWCFSSMGRKTLTVQLHSARREAAAKARLTVLQSRYTPEAVLKETGLNIGNCSWDRYVSELRETFQEFFGSPQPNFHELVMLPQGSEKTHYATDSPSVQRTRARLADFLELDKYAKDQSQSQNFWEGSRGTISPGIPRTIYTTSAEDSLPPMLATWEERNSEDGWRSKS